MQIPAKSAAREKRLTDLSAVGPDRGLRTHQARECAAASKCASTRTCQRDLRKEQGLGNTDLGICGDENLFGLANIRPSLKQRGRQARRHVRRKRLLWQRTSALHALRIIADEDADGIFFLGNLALEIRDSSICGVEHLLRLEHVQPCGYAAVQSERSQPDGIFLRLHRVLRDLQFEIKLKERQVRTRHVAYKRERHRMLRLLASQQLGARRFSRASIPAKEIQLEGGVQGERQKVKSRLEVLFFSSAKGTAALRLRKLIGARYSKLGALGIDALSCQLKIVILLQRRTNQFLQLRVLENLPPGKSRIRCRLFLDLRTFSQIAILGRSLNRGLVVVRAHRAACDQARCQDYGNQWPKFFHKWHSCA